MNEESFVWTRVLGQGGMGRAFDGEHLATGARVVLKTPLMSTRAAARAFLAEARAAARVDHPNVVAIHDFGTFDTSRRILDTEISSRTPYVIVDFVEGAPLSRDVARAFSSPRALVERALDALAKIHAVGVIHRDLKPANIIADAPRDAFQIIDFGLSIEVDDALDEAAVGGTLTTLAPEQIDPTHHFGQGPWTDIYALGCVLFYWLTGHYPFLGESVRAMHDLKSIGLDPHALAMIPAAWSDWLLLALSPDPRERFFSAAHAQAALPPEGPETSWEALDEHHRAEDRGGRVLSSFWESSQLLSVEFSSELTPTTASSRHRGLARPSLDALPRQVSSPVSTGALDALGLGILSLRRSPLFGRDDERQRLLDDIAAVVRGGRPRALVCCGEAGIGKSALARWASEMVQARLGGHGLEITQGDGGGNDALRACLERWCGLSGVEDVATRRRRASARLSYFTSVAVGEEPSLRTLVEGLAGQSDSSQRLDDFGDAFCWFVRALSKSAPVVLVWDVDTDDERDQVGALVQRLTLDADAQLLVIVTARDWPEDSALERRVLRPISQRAQQVWLSSVLALEPASASVILDRARGNPFFTLRLLQDWIERGVLLPTPDGFRPAEETTGHIPEDLYQLCLERFRGMLDDARAVAFLEALAILEGRRSDEEIHALANEVGVVADRWLDLLQERQILEPSAKTWRFAQRLLQETLRTRCEASDRLDDAHRVCASALAKVNRQTSRAWRARIEHELARGQLVLVSRIARKFLPTLDASEARRWLADFTSDHAEAFAASDLATIWSMLLEVVILQGEGDREGLADALERIRNHPRLEACNQDPEIERTLLYSEAVLAVSNWELEVARAKIDALLALLGEQQEHAPRRHATLRVQANMYAALGMPEEAIASLERALELVPRESWDHAWGLYQLSGMHEELGRLDASLECCLEALAFFEEHEDASGRASCLTQLASLDLGQENYDDAMRRFEQSARLYRQCGDGAEWLARENVLRARFMGTDTMRHEDLDEVICIQSALDEKIAFPSFVLDLRLLAAVELSDWDALAKALGAFDPSTIEGWMYDPGTFAPTFITRAIEQTQRAGRGEDVDALERVRRALEDAWSSEAET